MNETSVLSAGECELDLNYVLDSRNRVDADQIFLSGTQALVRLPLVQAELDRSNGLNTAGFITGYRGSPLAAYDRALWQTKDELEKAKITFLPAVNEDLAATAIIGTQEVESDPDATVDGVFAIWYGKGPGVDRSIDALKHGNAIGSSQHGGVLIVFGDDHGCISSAMPHQSEQALMSLPVPILNPASVSEYVSFGLYGIALSRFSGAWVGFKAASETVESGRSITIDETPEFTDPVDFEMPETGLHCVLPSAGGQALEDRNTNKYHAVQAFMAANPLDRVIYRSEKPALGIVTTGKAHLDVMDALDSLGIDAARADKLGLTVLKIGVSFPLSRDGISAFANGLDEIVVVEEKRSIVEFQLKDILYNHQAAARPEITGKFDRNGNAFLPERGEFVPSMLAPLLADRVLAHNPGVTLAGGNQQMAPEAELGDFQAPPRLPYFCSGCPHNISTVVPEGSKAFAGVGCHVMASWMDRDTEGLIHMGGEGGNWAGRAPFTGNGHVFQNMGDGTYFHSGYSSIRQAVAARINITYKILFNGAVGMTGGQPVDGELTPEAIARQVHAEGVGRIVMVSDDVSRVDRPALPPGATVHDREEMPVLQRSLREEKGVSVLIYDQICAAEKRRRRKHDDYPDPRRYVFINELVCEGCSDCVEASNCLSVVPKITKFGVKRSIDQSSCNKDFSCLKGYCPALITVENARPVTKTSNENHLAELVSQARELDQPHYKGDPAQASIVVAGIGGTGIVTIGAVLTMAAHLEGKGCSSLDFMGLAQKGGGVVSHVKIFENRACSEPSRIDRNRADVLLACDGVMAATPEVLAMLKPGVSRTTLNLSTAASTSFILTGKSLGDTATLAETLAKHSREIFTLKAGDLAQKFLGDLVYSNMIVMGAAWQSGLLPVSYGAIMRAVELNGNLVDNNKHAFDLGRLAIAKPDLLGEEELGIDEHPKEELDDLIEARRKFLTSYQNENYALEYTTFVDEVRVLETEGGSVSVAVAKNLFKLMAYKDEYEVARLYTRTGFIVQIRGRFEDAARINIHLVPGPFSWKRDAKGRPRKVSMGPWMLKVMSGLSRLKFLRGTVFDPFGYGRERSTERQLIGQYRKTVIDALNKKEGNNIPIVIRIAEAPEMIRGFGQIKMRSVEKYQEHLAMEIKRLEKPVSRCQEAAKTPDKNSLV